jgi:ribonuclease BN (tRNA processing enzyme)
LPELTFLGTGGSFVSGSRVCSGIYIGRNLLDCGFGVLTNLRRAGISLDSIDRVFVTHTHSDHIGDFTGLIWAMGLEGRKERLEVVSSGKTAATLRRVMELQSTSPQILGFEIDYLEPADADVRYCTTIHVPTNYAYRLRVEGKAITYTGDTAPCREVVELAEGSDLLIHDSTYLADSESLAAITLHSSARQAAAAAREAGARMLALTHIFPGISDRDFEEEARRVQGVNSILAKDLLRITV